MKLHEIKRVRSRFSHDEVEVEPAGGIYGVFKVDVAFEYTPASSSQHERDDSSFRERHSSELSIHSIKLAGNVEERDENDKIVSTYKKGDDARKLPGWDRSDDEYVEEKLRDQLDYYDE